MKKSVLLIGDTIIDKYVYLSPTGFSLETPTVKCQKIKERKEYGGAANVARKLTQLGCEVDFITSLSFKEKNTLELINNLNVICVAEKDQIKERFYLTKNKTYKYLQINDCREINISIPRLDVEKYDTIIVSDYRLGVASEGILKLLPKNNTICQMQISDSNAKIEKYKGFHCFVGNEDEVPKLKIEKIRNKNRFDVCVSTGGSKEITAITHNKTFHHRPVELKKIRDYHGAGDSFFAGFCFSYNGKNIQESIEFGDRTAKEYLTRNENVE